LGSDLIRLELMPVLITKPLDKNVPIEEAFEINRLFFKFASTFAPNPANFFRLTTDQLTLTISIDL
jgi:hypothetical protein